MCWLDWPPAGKSVKVPAKGSVRLVLDGFDDLHLLLGQRRSVVAVSQTAGKRKLPLVSIQLINTTTHRAIYSENNFDMVTQQVLSTTTSQVFNP